MDGLFAIIVNVFPGCIKEYVQQQQQQKHAKHLLIRPYAIGPMENYRMAICSNGYGHHLA